ncbi:CGG triplet repeat-binding protein 1 isoform X1 [Alligator mississippiensis]|uniref:CGG triplet repeat-binding protein 1 isoform X1 n=3 Tax=Alligator TaxID=8495 RepID=A0A1U7SAZ9_ALLSI|nr:CGG triplet repeat-binding protein 1 isoform X1 [Alligator sinensis]XP_006259445.1 CGG triplet repeat-binding protein 1 isoform X1 [Alligator mississippiensis]
MNTENGQVKSEACSRKEVSICFTLSPSSRILLMARSVSKTTMERFGVKTTPSRNRSKTALYVTPQDRVTEFGSDLHEEGGKLFCTSCNVVLNHVRKSAINDHLKSKTHTKRKAEFEEQNTRKKQRTLTASLQCNSTSQTEKTSVIQDFVKMCLEANIPLEKADHPSVRAFLSRHVKNGSSIPKSDQLRKAYLPDGYENENQLLNTEDR